MTHEPKNFIVIDPRTLDGDPYEVAEKAVLQVQALTELVAQALETAVLMARNADMERRLADGDAAGIAVAWEQSAQARQFREVTESLETAAKRLGTLARAAAFNPKETQ